MARSEREDSALHGSLKQLVSQLSEAHLLLIHGWILQEIPRSRRRGPRLVRVPTTDDLREFDGSVAELVGAIRRSIHELPETSLIVLNKWVLDQLRAHHPRVGDDGNEGGR